MFIFTGVMKYLILLLFSVLLGFALQAQVIINPCARATDIHVVVIGSSTAAGTGPTNSANAWVNRYRTYLQSINPNNLVTNLAVGGTTTYHIMPDWFVSPIAGRPAVTPTKNVSQAITLGADAIIVNMPSNDAANGFGTNEQMFNFQTIVSVADSAGIPVWVCTTQPRNGFNATQLSIQTGVRDSVLSFFGSKAIDFWNPFASTGNTLLAAWDSGDGVHMNDTAHAVLNQRVIGAGIPNLVVDTLPYTDHVISSVYVSNPTLCGDSSTRINVILTNIGAANAFANSNLVTLRSYDYQTNVFLSQYTAISIYGIDACASDTLFLNVNTFNGQDLNYHAYINGGNDFDKSNDTSDFMRLKTIGHPSITGMNDTVLTGANAQLLATTGSGDTIVWYDAPSGGNILGYGNQYSINNVTANQTVYPEAVRGPLHFRNSLFTVANTTTDWNGMMFDIVAHNNIIIDSLEIKVNTIGMQNVVCYNRQGSLVGNEMNSAAWTYWGLDSVDAINAGDFEIIRMPAVSLNTNDTLGVYVHMQNGSSQLSYLNSSATTYSNNEVSVLNGTGVTHTFGTTYSPRNWSGRVYYHYGFNPQGDCQSERLPVSAIIKWPTGMENIESIGLKIFPNPSNGILHFEGENIPELVIVKDLQGRTVRTNNVRLGQINLSDLQSGLYFLTFEIEGKRFAQKIVLE